MKKLALIGLILGMLTSCNQEAKRTDTATQTSEQKTESAAKISFEKMEHNFNQILSGEKVAYSFRFTNTGNLPLLITGTRSGCGCTVGDYPKDPIKPGEQGKIDVVFNSAGRKGFQTQSISILNNTNESPITLRIIAEVSEK